MPGWDGLELCHRIRSRVDQPYIYVIMLTARTDRQDRLEGLHAGADDFLTKPVDHEELKVCVLIAHRIVGMQAELEEKNACLKALATTDPLTSTSARELLDGSDRALHHFKRTGRNRVTYSHFIEASAGPRSRTGSNR
jgi:PleD family two-component response regulator